MGWNLLRRVTRLHQRLIHVGTYTLVLFERVSLPSRKKLSQDIWVHGNVRSRREMVEWRWWPYMFLDSHCIWLRKNILSRTDSEIYKKHFTLNDSCFRGNIHEITFNVLTYNCMLVKMKWLYCWYCARINFHIMMYFFHSTLLLRYFSSLFEVSFRSRFVCTS